MARRKTIFKKDASEAKEKILQGIMQGKWLTAICREEGMPSRETVYHWMTTDEEFRSKMLGARAAGIFSAMEEMEELSTAPLEGHTREDILRNSTQVRNRLDILKFYVAKLGPAFVKELRTTQQVEHTGSVESQQIVVMNYSQPKLPKTKDVGDK